jgi:hypothetical protein
MSNLQSVGCRLGALMMRSRRLHTHRFDSVMLHYAHVLLAWADVLCE